MLDEPEPDYWLERDRPSPAQSGPRHRASRGSAQPSGRRAQGRRARRPARIRPTCRRLRARGSPRSRLPAIILATWAPRASPIRCSALDARPASPTRVPGRQSRGSARARVPRARRAGVSACSAITAWGLQSCLGQRNARRLCLRTCRDRRWRADCARCAARAG